MYLWNGIIARYKSDKKCNCYPSLAGRGGGSERCRLRRPRRSAQTAGANQGNGGATAASSAAFQGHWHQGTLSSSILIAQFFVIVDFLTIVEIEWYKMTFLYFSRLAASCCSVRPDAAKRSSLAPSPTRPAPFSSSSMVRFFDIFIWLHFSHHINCLNVRGEGFKWISRNNAQKISQ